MWLVSVRPAAESHTKPGGCIDPALLRSDACPLDSLPVLNYASLSETALPPRATPKRPKPAAASSATPNSARSSPSDLSAVGFHGDLPSFIIECPRPTQREYRYCRPRCERIAVGERWRGTRAVVSASQSPAAWRDVARVACWCWNREVVGSGNAGGHAAPQQPLSLVAGGPEKTDGGRWE
ncbi:hypothetical protein PAPYR_6364 [Paratrimastix pyriformis]|uniref:Uncharacterized protein n=1 Tax=Paratrimastix pyriformis TaxID=342808 RepID=A0ABQ8UHR6_9EUKA|nr:hypothetical protein PAPYR_6364 [Paratrimastix pyriformis]